MPAPPTTRAARRYPLNRLLLLLVLAVACSPRSTATSGQDAASDGLLGADAGLDSAPDAPVSDLLVTDLAPVEAAGGDVDADAGGEVADGDVAGDADGSSCDLDAVTEPVDATSTGPACKAGCVPPYPCGCDGCAWLNSPDMNLPRVDAGAFWTGSEVLVVGGHTGYIDKNGVLASYFHKDLERWNPKEKEFTLVPAPADLPAGNGQDVQVMAATWTGKYLVAASNNAWTYRYDPASGTWAGPAKAGNKKVKILRMVQSDGGVFAEIYSSGPAAIEPGSMFGVLDPETMTVEAIPAPPESTAGVCTTSKCLSPGITTVISVLSSGCMVSTGADILLFDAWNREISLLANVVWPDGHGIKYAHGLRYNVATKTWSTMATAPIGITCSSINDNSAMRSWVGSFPGGLFVFGPIIENPAKKEIWTNVGAVYWSATDSWTKVSTFGLPGPRSNFATVWTGKTFAVLGGTGAKPDCPWPWDGCGSGYLYDPYADTWTAVPQLGSMHDGRSAEAVAASDTELFMLGGANGTYSETYHKDGRRWHLPVP